MSDSIKVVISDDHGVLRSGLRALLEAEDDIEVIGEAATGAEAVEQAKRLRPDVIIMDLSMPEASGLDATRRIGAFGLNTKVLVLTVHPEEDSLLPVLDAGATGYLTKSSADRNLVKAIRAVARGEVFLSPHAAKLLLERYKATDPENADPLERLTQRERLVLSLTAAGYSSREIGEQLSISAKTVDTYRGRIGQKLKISHRSELVRFALRNGLLKEP